MIKESELKKTISAKAWKKIGYGKKSGVAIPLFSVYSKKSCGIGEYTDIELLADWCNKTGNSVLQLLPMNELGGVNCPYDAISSFALEPVFISLNSLPVKVSAELVKRISIMKKIYDKQPAIDYNLKNDKLEILWKIFLENEQVIDCKDFQKYCTQSSYWLNDYALFKELKFVYGGSAWFDWEEDFKNRNEKALNDFADSHAKGIKFHKWIQWIAYTQFKKAKEYAAKKGVFIKGDMPVLVSRDSADVWAQKHYFKLDKTAGAPPDMYSAKGQRWGMPVYNWTAIENDEFVYIISKLKYAENFYDIVRIDHVVGIFRIWSIDNNESWETQGLNGKFDPEDESLWENQGRKILSAMIKNSSVLFCAEDLGVVPPVCVKVLKEFGIPGNDVQRWVKDWEGNKDFTLSEKYRTMSVAMLSTHDTSNWAAWWENEASTVDAELFEKKCKESGVDFNRVKEELFDSKKSKQGQLRWKKQIADADIFKYILRKPADQVPELMDLYLSSYGEKESLWKQYGRKGAMEEKSSHELIKSALLSNMKSASIFCIEGILDWLIFAGVYKKDYYSVRINKPGTVGDHNWTLKFPVSLEDMNKLPDNKKILAMIKKAGRFE